MPGSARVMAWCTVLALVVITAYSVTLEPSGWLWFGWVVVGLLTMATCLARRE
jgi:hypothetical protein